MSARRAVALVRELHKPIKIYAECECPEGTHPDDYDYIDCDQYVGCHNSLVAVGCQECCSDGESITERCWDAHKHGMNPKERCATIAAITTATEKP